MNRKKEVIGHLLAFITIFIWGITFISTKILLKDFTALEILFIRFLIGFVALFILSPHRFKLKEKKQEIYFVFAGLCGTALYFLLENIALTYTSASNVGVIISVAPFFTAIFAHLFLDKEKLKAQFFVGFIVALCGICLISFNGSRNIHLNPIGDFLSILAAVVWAVYSILSRKISSFQYDMIQSTRRIFFYGLLFMVPLLFIFGFNPDFHQLIQPVNLFNLVFLGLGASALCFVMWNSAVKIIGAVKTSVYIYIMPVVTVITSIIILHEIVTAIMAIGIALTLIGLFISEFKSPMK